MTAAAPSVAGSAWERMTLLGLQSFARGRAQEAAEHWRDALHAANGFGGTDPRGAAAFNNAAVGLIGLDRLDDAVNALNTARQRWQSTLESIAAIDPPLTGRGSIFHIRLAARHGETFADVHRQTLRVLVQGARALSAFNLMIASGQRLIEGDRAAEVNSLVREAEMAFGTQCAEVQSMTDALRGALRTAGATERQRPLHERWRAGTWKNSQPDIRALLAATHLTALADRNAAASSQDGEAQTQRIAADASRISPRQQGP